MPRVIGLQLHEHHGLPLRQVSAVRGRVGGGLVGDSHEASPKRAVLIVDRSTLDDLGLSPGDLREQITVEGLREVTALPEGTRLHIGRTVLQVNGPCLPCTHIGALLDVDDPERFRALLDGRRGVLCVVVAEGDARIGDAVEVRPPIRA